MPYTPSLFPLGDTSRGNQSDDQNSLAVLRLLREFRYLSGRQLTLAVSLRPECLDDLSKAGILIRLDLPEGLGVESPVFALGRQGADLLRQRDGENNAVVSYLRLSDKPKSLLFLGHTLKRNEFALCLHQALKQRSDARLLHFDHAQDRLADFVWLVEKGKAERVPLVADAFFGLATGKGEKFFLLEVDRGTSALKRMALRYRGYEAWRRERGPENRFGVPNLRILTTGPNKRRLEALKRACLETQAPSGFFLFSEESVICLDTPHQVLETIWKKAKEAELISLLE